MQTFGKLGKTMLVVCAAVPLLAGCDAARESLVAFIAPAGAHQVAGSLRREIAQGKFVQASTRGARCLEDKRDAAGVVAWETGRASVQSHGRRAVPEQMPHNVGDHAGFLRLVHALCILRHVLRA
jgi:hypothetical protein